MILNIAMKEIQSFFVTPMGWIIIALITAAFGWNYFIGVNNYFEVMSGAILPKFTAIIMICIQSD